MPYSFCATQEEIIIMQTSRLDALARKTLLHHARSQRKRARKEREGGGWWGWEDAPMQVRMHNINVLHETKPTLKNSPGCIPFGTTTEPSDFACAGLWAENPPQPVLPDSWTFGMSASWLRVTSAAENLCAMRCSAASFWRRTTSAVA